MDGVRCIIQDFIWTSPRWGYVKASSIECNAGPWWHHPCEDLDLRKVAYLIGSGVRYKILAEGIFMRKRILSLLTVLLILSWIPVAAQDRMGTSKNTDPLELPFGMDPSKRGLESSSRLREALQQQDLRVDPDPNRRMFRPKQPEPGYSQIHPYPGSDTPTRIRPLRPLP